MMINIHIIVTWAKGVVELIISVLIFTYIYLDTDITNTKQLFTIIAANVKNCVIYIMSSFQETFLLSSVFI